MSPRAPVHPTVAFTITHGHALARGLGGGRVRVRAGETAVEAVTRRIARETGHSVAAVTEETRPAASEDHPPAQHYRITLRGHVGPRREGGEEIEGTLWVKF